MYVLGWRALGQSCLLAVLMFCPLLPWVSIAQIAQRDGALEARGINYHKFKFEHLSTPEGLSTRHTTCMLQDKYGFLWIGTQQGLNRYDGATVVAFDLDSRGSASLGIQYVRSIYEDRKGVIWASTDELVARYDRASENFRTLRPTEDGIAWFFGQIQEDGSGMLWLMSERGLCSLNPLTDTFTFHKSSKGTEGAMSSERVTSLYKDKDGRIWIGTRDGGLNKYDPITGRFSSFRNHPRNHSSLSNDHVTAMVEDQGGALWISTYGGLNRMIDPTQGIFERYTRKTHGLPTDTLLTFYCDGTGTLWIGTMGGGLCKVDPKTRNVETFKPDPANTQSPENIIGSIYEDCHNNLWIWRVSLTSGLHMFDRKTGRFTKYVHDPRDAHSLSNDYILSLYEDRAGSLCIVTHNGGINRIDPGSKRFRHFVNDPLDLNSLRGNIVERFSEGKTGIVWIATFDGGVNRFDPRTNRFTHYADSPPHLWSLLEDSEGILWTGSTGLTGLQRLDPGRERFTLYWPDLYDRQRLSENNELNEIFEDKEGVLWVGTTEGLYAIDRRTGKSERYANDSVGTNVRVIYEDSEGTLWCGMEDNSLCSFDRKTGTFRPRFGTGICYGIVESSRSLWLAMHGGGLVRFDPISGRYARSGEEQGLPSNYLEAILKDAHGKIWISTLKNISRYDPSTNTFRNFGAGDGIEGTEFIERAACRTRNGEMYFGGHGGFIVFHPDSVKDNEHIPPVWITTIRISNKVVRFSRAIMDLDTVEFSHDQNSVSFEYVALNYTNAGKNQYKYKLEGFDKEWTNAGTTRIANYTNLDPGEYTFRVKGSNNDGLWNEIGDSLAVIIHPPWWATAWAYGAYGLFTLVVLYSIRRSEKNRERLKHQAELEHTRAESLHQVDQLKSRFFANISHEFRTPLTLIEGPANQIALGDVTEDARELGRMIGRNTRRLLLLVNQLLDLSKIESGQMRLRLRESNLVEIVKGIAASFESSAVRKRIRFNVEVSETPIIGWFDRDVVEKVVTNLLSNALKFTSEGGQVTVSVGRRASSTNSEIELIVKDTGIGIATDQLDRIFDRFYQVDDTRTQEHEGTGIGLALTKELVELHKGTIEVQSVTRRGSRFTVRIPFGREHWRQDEIIEREAEVKDGTAAKEEVEEREPVTIDHGDVDTDETLPLLLIVEDNADMRKYIRTYLDNKYGIIEAANGDEGVQKAIATIPDLVISDLMMPKMDGFEMCSRLKTDERTSHVPIILLTAKAGIDNRIEGLETGADDYLVKPFEPKELLIRAQNLIEQRRKLREKFTQGIALRPGEVVVRSMDDTFLKKVLTIVEQHLGEETFGVERLVHEVSMSRMQLHRKLKALTDLSASEFIRYLRLQRAMELLKRDAGTIAEIAYTVGFGSPSYFTKCFHEQFAMAPSDVRRGEEK